ncbi:hypothetical protein BJ878DRAFT_567042 [Calycina marina]|uniref:Uncharacterized protein n=1 Tax=Calycina marina TaxID=1763456 RepID=A0A9P8CFD1_9HELO|nr:hypothetical protein BJ878DRAFT_567042 [Calycina marina]
MTDTPNLPHPLDSREEPILYNLMTIRDDLTHLKQDRTTYVKSSDVMELYERVVQQVNDLNEIRADKPQEQNRVDRVLDGCFQLISLFFMTIGRNNDAPAAYALTSTIKRLLDHFTQVKLYSAKDLAHVTRTLENIKNIMNKESDYDAKLITLLANRVTMCESLLEELKVPLVRLQGHMPKLHETLISILRSLSLANTRSKFSTTEVTKLRKQGEEVAAQQVDGKFVGEYGNVISGNEEVCELLALVFQWSDIVLERKGVIPESFLPQYKTLVEIRNTLERISLTQAWSLRETDLYDYQRQLDKIDESRVDYNFVDADGNFADLYIQRTLLYLIRRSYGYIYYLMVSSEPVSEALLPVYNQLQTLKRCLVEVQNSGGVASARELYPYSMKLTSIESMRVDGKFMCGDEIPEGQGSVNDLLHECYDISYELQVAVANESEPEKGE